MPRVASLFLPQLAVERLRRLERPSISPPEPRRPLLLPVDDDPGACSVPRGGAKHPGTPDRGDKGWQPNARDSYWPPHGDGMDPEAVIRVKSHDFR